mmetsp:Transcript_23829/g.52118  ORF Transcript_23829/g.52118 Transcript_23829/m.52118 type:complete len:804 (-) Transcript_23829:107-2518(-)
MVRVARYTRWMQNRQNNLLSRVPEALKANSEGNNKEDVDKAMAFLEEYSSQARHQPWIKRLIRWVVMKQQTPETLATLSPMIFARFARDEDHCGLLDQMLLADGASGGHWVKALEIYEEIIQTSDNVDYNAEELEHPILQRLAVAIALVHATPVTQVNAIEQQTDQPMPDVVDPIKRYLNYERAYLEGELDPSFPLLTTWDLKHVVDGDEPDEIAAWGRRTLKNFYPQHALQNNPNWSYAAIVKSDIPYGSSRVVNDDPKLQKYQNILHNGGICGRRAFFGRFILRAFGIPTTARPSKGHAALCHWTGPDRDWSVNLGGNWGKGWTNTIYVKDMDFLASAQARRYNPEEYFKVKVAQWIGELCGETKRVYGIHDPHAKHRKGVLLNLESRAVVGRWYYLSLKVQERIINGGPSTPHMKADSSGHLITDIDAASEEPAKTGSYHHGRDLEGRATISIPADSYEDPTKTKEVTIMKGFRDSDNGGNQQIYLPPFSPTGITVLRGGTFKEVPTGRCSSGARLPSAGQGKYSDWGFRAAMTLDEDHDANNPEPTMKLSLDEDNTVFIEFVYIPPGEFVMGGQSTTDNQWSCVEVPHHRVKITDGFYMGKYPVTQKQFETVLRKNTSRSTKQPECPIEAVDLENATNFCSRAAQETGTDIRLPTEAEWEYAARGKTNGDSADPLWFFGDDESKMDDYAWYKSNSGGKTHPVGLKLPNPFGLYDIYGNVCERVADTYKKEYYAESEKKGVVVNPIGPLQGINSKFRYQVENIPAAGNYTLTAKVCTINVDQSLNVLWKVGTPTLTTLSP